MSEVFKSTITPEEQAFLFSKIDNFYNIDEKNCHIWKGDIADNYPSIRVMFRERRIRIRVHRLMFYLFNNAIPLDSKIHVSHLCHNKLCVNIEHLSYEQSVINAQRNSCFSAKKCFGHAGYKNCIV